MVVLGDSSRMRYALDRVATAAVLQIVTPVDPRW
jgi:hypothetical protein